MAGKFGTPTVPGGKERESEKERERRRGKEAGASGGRRWPAAAVGGFSSPISSDRTFNRARKREIALGGGGDDLPDGCRLHHEALDGR